MHCDSQSVLHLIKNHMYHERTKHINIRLHFKDIVDKEMVSLKKIPTEDNPTNMLTKILSIAKFKLCLDLARIDTILRKNILGRGIEDIYRQKLRRRFLFLQHFLVN